jgi:hypothetical protein
MGKLSLRDTGSPYVYEEILGAASAAIGLDESDSGKLKVVVSTSSGATPQGADLKLTIDPAINGNITFTPNGTGAVVIANGDVNIQAGNLDLPNSNVGGTQGFINQGGQITMSNFGTGNFFIGNGSGNLTLNPAVAEFNTAVGQFVLIGLTTGHNNTCCGNGGMELVTTGSNNSGFGEGALSALVTGSNNTAVGFNAGLNYAGAESDNILIGSLGILGESNVIRIGTQGSGPGQQNSTTIAGIHGVTPGGSGLNMVTIDSTGLMGSQSIPGGGGISTLDGDSGSATGATVTIAGGSNISTSASGATVTINLVNSPSVSGSVTAGTGFSATTGDVAIVAGNLDLPVSNAAGTEGYINVGGSPFMSDFGTGNVFLGLSIANTTLNPASSQYNVLIGNTMGTGFTTAADNVGVGAFTFQDLTSGTTNTAFGLGALQHIVNGGHNLGLGQGAGANLTGAESDNIFIANRGVLADANTIRIGTQGSGFGQQNLCYIAGIYGVTPSAGGLNMVTIDNTGNLGSQAIPGGGGITWTEITVSQSMASNNGYITNSAGLITLTLPATASVGDLFGVVGMGTGGWLIAQNSGQTIHFGTSNTTTGAGGSLASSAQYDCVEFICITTNTDFVVRSSIGNLTVV